MSRFTDRLWGELVREHGAALAQIRRKPGRRVSRPRILAGTGAGLAAVGAAAALLVGAADTSPAFAVTKNHDGSVTLTIRGMGGLRAANARLRALGYRARLVEVAPGCATGALPSRGMPWTETVPPALAPAAAQVSIHTRFDPHQIPAHRLLVIAAWVQSRRISIAPAHLVRGAAPVCLPAPPPPAVFVKPAGRVTVRCVAGPVRPHHAGPPVQYYLGPPDSVGHSAKRVRPALARGGCFPGQPMSAPAPPVQVLPCPAPAAVGNRADRAGRARRAHSAGHPRAAGH